MVRTPEARAVHAPQIPAYVHFPSAASSSSTRQRSHTLPTTTDDRSDEHGKRDAAPHHADADTDLFHWRYGCCCRRSEGEPRPGEDSVRDEADHRWAGTEASGDVQGEKGDGGKEADGAKDVPRPEAVGEYACKDAAEEAACLEDGDGVGFECFGRRLA